MDFTSAASFDKITQAIEKINKGNQSDDDRFWQPATGKDGNGYAEIRFLPTPPVDGSKGLPWVLLYSYGFKGPTGLWYIENSTTTLGQKDPATELSNKLYAQGKEEWLRKNNRFRRTHYISNIYIVDDPENPENNGTVKLFRYGKKIFDKLQAAMKPEFKDEKPLNPFDLIGGATFKIKIRKVEGYRNYDKSEFGTPGRLGDFDDDKLNEIWQQCESLLEFIDPKHFKSYDELKARLEEVLGESVDVAQQVPESKPSMKQDMDDDIPDFGSRSDDDSSDSEDSGDDISLDYLRQLAESA